MPSRANDSSLSGSGGRMLVGGVLSATGLRAAVGAGMVSTLGNSTLYATQFMLVSCSDALMCMREGKERVEWVSIEWVDVEVYLVNYMRSPLAKIDKA